MKRYIVLLLFLPLLILGCNQAGTGKEIPAEPPQVKPSEPVKYAIVEAYPRLKLNQPLHYTYADDQSNLVYVVERTGKIKYFTNNPEADSAQVFLNLSGKIDLSGQEKGLLGLAFHPRFKENGYFYVNYTNKGSTVIARYKLNPENPAIGDPNSENVLVSFSQPYANHNGGHLAFGPDGYLYIATGDGGLAGDPHNNAQNLKTFLGKILRIDVDSRSANKTYGIPPDNPLAGNTNGYLEEIYAYGLRNPWKFSFDQERKLLWAADVGQNQREEINIIEKGKNYGWKIMEGTLEYSSSPNVDKKDLTPPLWEFERSQGRSVTGGYVYYGKNTPSLQGAYIYGDYVTGRIWALRLDENKNPQNYELLDTDLRISSFGVDQNHELYIIGFGGSIYKIKEVKQ